MDMFQAYIERNSREIEVMAFHRQFLQERQCRFPGRPSRAQFILGNTRRYHACYRFNIIFDAQRQLIRDDPMTEAGIVREDETRGSRVFCDEGTVGK